jgi:hypothetical protein
MSKNRIHMQNTERRKAYHAHPKAPREAITTASGNSCQPLAGSGEVTVMDKSTIFRQKKEANPDPPPLSIQESDQSMSLKTRASVHRKKGAPSSSDQNLSGYPGANDPLQSNIQSEVSQQIIMKDPSKKVVAEKISAMEAITCRKSVPPAARRWALLPLLKTRW